MHRRAFLVSSSLAWAAPPLPSSSELLALRERCSKVLLENILPFWYPATLDHRHGGFTLHHDGQGVPKGPGVKMIVTQARMLWFFARLARFGHEPKSMLAAAEHGYKFLRSALWDEKYGGFFWECDAVAKPTKRNKHLYGQSFALSALAEYALASGRKDVLDFAMRFFALLEEQAHDSAYGGYVEYFLPDWSTPAPNEQIYLAGSAPGIKLMNTHLHLLEAMTALYRVSKHPTVRQRLLELMSIESSAVLRKAPVAATDKFDRDWSPRLEAPFARVSYGHDLENIWLLADAASALQMPVHPYRDLFEANFSYCRQFGFDAAQGGFYSQGELSQPADDRSKSWWVQAEALVAALTMYKLTSKTSYFEVFRLTWDFCDRKLIDWKHGDWHARILANGAVQGDKAGPWKAAYHNGRAMIECIKLLKELEKKTI